MVVVKKRLGLLLPKFEHDICVVLRGRKFFMFNERNLFLPFCRVCIYCPVNNR